MPITNPFADDPDRALIWEMLMPRDFEAFATQDWAKVADDFDAGRFLGIHAHTSPEPDEWDAVFPTLEAYREMPYNDQVVQAKEGQAESLYRNMEQSLVSRIMRRLTSPDVRLAVEKSQSAKPGDEEGPVYSTTPPPQNNRQPWNRPSITNGPPSLDDDTGY